MGLAAAALIAIGAVALFSNLQAPLGPNQALADRTAAASYVASEHGHCITDTVHASRKLALQDSSELPAFTSSVVGSEIALADLVANGTTDIRFVDAGACQVPGGGPSMHMRFRLPDMPEKGLWKFQSSSWQLAQEIPDLSAHLKAGESGAGTLSLKLIEWTTKAGETRKFTKPVLQFDSMLPA